MFFKSKKVKKVFLVRHGQSMANIDPSKNRDLPDHKIELTEHGEEQADQAGLFLNDYLRSNLKDNSFVGKANRFFTGKQYFQRIRMWNSPYERTRRTADIVFTRCSDFIADKREHALLAEQRFGVFDGLSDEERAEMHPEFYRNYEKAKDAGGKMWPKMPLGDSRFDVCQRVHQAFGTFHRDAQRHDIENIVVIGHGTTNRAFILMWMHYPYEWMHEEPNPNNCSIRLLEDGEDKGYIFEGFKH